MVVRGLWSAKGFRCEPYEDAKNYAEHQQVNQEAKNIQAIHGDNKTSVRVYISYHVRSSNPCQSAAKFGQFITDDAITVGGRLT